MSLADLRNLGDKSAQMLAAAGIHSHEDLVQLGPVRAFLAARQAGSNPSLNLLWAIAGALTDTDWRELSEEYKQSLQQELDELLG